MASQEVNIQPGQDNVMSESNLRKTALQHPYIEDMYRDRSRDLTSASDLHDSTKTSATGLETNVRRIKPLPASVSKLSINTGPDTPDETVRIHANGEAGLRTHTLFVESSAEEKAQQTKATKRLSFLIDGMSAEGFQENYGLNLVSYLVSPREAPPEITAQNSTVEKKYVPLHRRSVSGLIISLFSALIGRSGNNKVAPSG